MIVVTFLNITIYLNAITDCDKYEIRSNLLMEAMSNVGVFTPDNTAEVWANGLKNRSAAAQYSVMTQDLKNNYAKQLENSFPNWVTGVSSPWVDNFEIVEKENPCKNTVMFHIRFYTKTSTGPAESYNAVITVAKEENSWRITDIFEDEGLYVYTGYKT